MNPPLPNWTPCQTTVPVHIPDTAGNIAEIIQAEVPAWKDAAGEIYLTGETEAILDAMKLDRMIRNQAVQLPTECSRVIDAHFWELLL